MLRNEIFVLQDIKPYEPFIDIDGLTYYFNNPSEKLGIKKVKKRLIKSADCTCNNVTIMYHRCRCTCDKCGSKNLLWQSWGSGYLDKDLVCQNCKHIQSTWNC